MPRRPVTPIPPLHANAHVDTVLRVRYAETDQMGIVYYANYLVWFEVGRGAFCRERGIDYIQMEREGLGLPTVEARCRYLSPARFDDEVTIRTWTTETRRSLLTFHYEAWRGETLLATGETRHILLDRDGKPRSFPPDIAARFTNPL
jgi:acyl-CoA thioester hydrolase